MVSSAAGVLKLIRDEVATDWIRLNEFWEVRTSSAVAGNPQLYSLLRELRSLGLVAWKGDFRNGGKIQVTERFRTIQGIFDFSLTDLMHIKDGSGMTVIPLFAPPRQVEREEGPDVFVAMPFDRELENVWKHIRACVLALRLTVKRADDFFTPRSIMEDIWAAICGSRVVVADCTGRNANVFYEIGLAHVVGRPVILITQNKKDVPFDLSHIRYIEYQRTPREMKRFERALATAVKEALNLEQ